MEDNSKYGQRAIHIERGYPPRPFVESGCACWDIYKSEVGRYVRDISLCFKHNLHLRIHRDQLDFATNTSLTTK